MAPLPIHLPSLPFFLLSLFILAQPCASLRPQVVEQASGSQQSSGNTTQPGNRTCSGSSVCKPGVVLPVWLPATPLTFWERTGRAFVYFICLLYMFVGVAIIADRFMASIEIITSQEREVTITQPDGETTVKTVRIWNETVANLSLMALGSSAPEILLAVIEVCGHNFEAGELGPGTIVGSAAFNMFVIIGLCVGVIPDGESRKIKHLCVFFITAFWSIFAYIWLYLILAVFSPGIIQVWEAVITLLFFPVCVTLAWLADRRLFYKCLCNCVDVIRTGKLSHNSGHSSRVAVSMVTSSELDQNKDESSEDKDLCLVSVTSTHSWREQFIEAVTVRAGNGDEEEGQERRLPSCIDYLMHIQCVFWKILFAFIPPTTYWNGWACFIVSIFGIGVLTAIIGDLASHFGCTIGLRDSVTAVIFVALGTSVPDTFASKLAATQDQYADASIVNVTGSNAVNVFLGIGVAWTVAAVYWEVKGDFFHVDPGSLAFSVTLFTICACITTTVLVLRRRPSVGGELGGPRILKILTSMLFFGLWLLYILFSSLEAYCIIRGF